MDTGTVGFKNEKQCWYVKNCPKNKEMLKKLEKSKSEKEIDYVAELEARQKEEMVYRKQKINEMKQMEKEERKKTLAMQELKSYKSLHNNAENVQSNDLGEGYKGTIDECRQMEEDFM